MTVTPIPVRRGDIYYINFGELPGSSEHGIRPGMIVQNNIGNRHAPTVIVAAIISSVKSSTSPPMCTLVPGSVWTGHPC